MPAVCMRHSVCEREGRSVGGRGKGGGGVGGRSVSVYIYPHGNAVIMSTLAFLEPCNIYLVT